METNKRTWVKAMTWQLLGLVVMTGINIWYLDNWLDSLGLALLLAGSGMVMFYLHERLWTLVRWGLNSVHHASAPDFQPSQESQNRDKATSKEG